MPHYEAICASVRIDNSKNVEDLSIYVKCLPKSGCLIPIPLFQRHVLKKFRGNTIQQDIRVRKHDVVPFMSYYYLHY